MKSVLVKGRKKSIRFVEYKGHPVCDLSMVGRLNKEDFKVLLKEKCLFKSKGKWFVVLHKGIKNKKKV